jgi:hypothetical protein
MIWSPSHGDTAFTVPPFDEYMRRIMRDGLALAAPLGRTDVVFGAASTCTCCAGVIQALAVSASPAVVQRLRTSAKGTQLMKESLL